MTLKLLKNLKSNNALTLSCLVALFSLSGCLNDDGDPDPIQIAYISIYHASPDADELDILVGDYTDPINNSPFGYGDYSDYISIHPGEWNFEFTESGNNENVLADTILNIENFNYYSIFIAEASSHMSTLVLTDSAGSPASGKAMIRFVHLSPDTPEVRVQADEEDLFEGQGFKEGTAFQEIEAGTFTFDFISTDSEEILLTTPDTEIKAGEFYTMVLKGFANPPAGNENELSTDIYRN